MHKILIVEDEPDLREILKTYFENEEYEILEAGSVAEAENIVDHESPEVVILDLNLPDRDGINLFKEIRQNKKNIECIILSAVQDVSQAVSVVKEGVFEYFEKPVELKHLSIAIRNALEKVRMRNEILKLRSQLSMNPVHKLAAIMITDIVGFTSISAQDEEKALELLHIQRLKLKPIIEEYGGTWLKEIGDGILITFSSSNQSLNCAVKIMEVVQDIDDLNLRIGIHQGDIMEEAGDVFGDDVNITSRIQPYADVGGIVISDKVQRDISSEPQFKTKLIGSPKLKGVTQKIQLYKVLINSQSSS
tara:strand:- start:2409 stop:3323 length:915 start_codon:yes stop_codon:yes gene_type:complete